MNAEKPKRGRPKKFVDLELVEKLAHIQCTYGEIAATLGVSVDTLQRNKNFAAVYKRGAEGGRKSLRRMQFEAANKGNATMQIWLGKQYLKQSDHGIVEVHSVPAFRDLTAQDLRQMLEQYVKTYPELASELNALEAEFTVEPQDRVKPAALLGN